MEAIFRRYLSNCHTTIHLRRLRANNSRANVPEIKERGAVNEKWGEKNAANRFNKQDKFKFPVTIIM